MVLGVIRNRKDSKRRVPVHIFDAGIGYRIEAWVVGERISEVEVSKHADNGDLWIIVEHGQVGAGEAFVSAQAWNARYQHYKRSMIAAA
ncbi:hypothetical protein SAMN06265795_103143 [Noviherbaspirillum humi]|uniref:Uncharacterized protein n=1 Tax=Noviherbaspirillum humi TaxID=1688639 RepID=A0A239F3J7_9BURK|nr:hypothetical protein [Noviherbaspirillum humi]SNS51088.1 hypothetical protein SAMN06265795_103143 [Noviherbaspirillum humi]